MAGRLFFVFFIELEEESHELWEGVKQVENEIKKKYLQDCIVVFVFTAILWILQIYMVSTVAGTTQDSIAKTVIILAGIIAVAFVTAAAAAVLVHLKKNQTKIYTEEIMPYEPNKSNNLKKGIS